VRPDRVLGKDQAFTDLADGQVAGQEPEHGELGVAWWFEQLAAGGAVARRLELLCHLVGERGNGFAVAAKRLPPLAIWVDDQLILSVSHVSEHSTADRAEGESAGLSPGWLRLLYQSERGGAGDRVGAGVDPELAVERTGV
jgi:hypothetical protein